MRPADKLKLWTGGYINRPDISPPLFLRIIMVLCMLSLIGTLVYAVFSILGNVDDFGGSIAGMMLLVVICFVFPLAILYAISTNSPVSRWLLVAYFGATSVAISNSSIVEPKGGSVVIGFVAFSIGSLMWLFASPRARVYFALVKHAPVPDELSHLVEKFTSVSASELWFRRLGKILEPLEPIFVLIFSIVLVIAGFKNLDAF